uniref:Uncharacterized protein n=1 Tax=Lutzomyia longipalpis TaxID=7200 RepID=A0A1B0CHY4_LUTLO
FQSKALRQITDAPWYVTNDQLHRDLNVLPVQEEIAEVSRRYRERLLGHENDLAGQLAIDNGKPRRLRKGHIVRFFHIFSIKLLKEKAFDCCSGDAE